MKGPTLHKILIPLALLCASASAQSADPVLAVIASQESAEAWQGVNAFQFGLPPGSALFIAGAVSDASPEILIPPDGVMSLTRSVLRLERPDRYRNTAQQAGCLPAGSGALIRHSLIMDPALP